MQWRNQVCKVVILKRQFQTSASVYLSFSLRSRRKSIVFYSRIMAITRSNELRHLPAARDTRSPRV
jgi:hypothetical protein